MYILTTNKYSESMFMNMSVSKHLLANIQRNFHERKKNRYNKKIVSPVHCTAHTVLNGNDLPLCTK